uniref:BTB domain-containing protein n=1 Tax=Periophthalmus magnuspinnatus TaxID=409849 RepID=A0A3B4BIB8_9GOBI
DDVGGGGRGLRGRLSRMGSRHRDNPRAQAQPERPEAPEPSYPAPAPPPTPLPPPMSTLPKRPDKSVKPKLPPRPLSKVFISKDHESDVLQGLDSFRVSDVLCDVVLIPGDSNEKFPVHRVIMASSSDYFKAMFTGGMREQEMTEIKLLGVTKLGLRSIIDFIYTSKVSLDMGNLQDTLEAANFLQVIPVLRFCNQLLCSEVTSENCVEVERIATDLNLEDVQANIGEFVSQNLPSLMESGLHLQLSATTMAKALSSNVLKGFSEMELYQIAKEWLDHDAPNRRSCFYTLMKHIRFPLMTPSDLIHISQAEVGREDGGDFLMRTDAACVNLLLEASNYQMMPYMQPALQTERTQIRSDSTHILALGGVMRQQLVVSRELRLYDEKTGHWRALEPMESPRYQHGVALLGGFLFIVGGQSTYDTKGKTAIDSAYRYDPRFNKWLQIASLNEKRTFFHLSALKGKLYAVGGRNATGEIDTVECYNLKKNEWTFVTNMLEPHYGHAGTVHGDLMYISGGITRDTFQKELWSYNPGSDTWTRRADMIDLRGLHCMCTVGDRLYVMGGNHFRGCSDYDDVLSCEYYSPATDQWTVVAPMPRGQSDVGVTVFNGQVYVVGGYSWNSRCMVDIVQRYDPEKDVWDRVFNVLEPLGGIRACTMTVHLPEGSVDEVEIQEGPLHPSCC